MVASVYIWHEWEDKYTVVVEIHSWMRVLQQMVHSNVPLEIREPRAFWAYHQTKPQTSDDSTFSQRLELP